MKNYNCISIVVFFLFCISCVDKTVKTNSNIKISFTLKNKNGFVLDNDTMPLRVQTLKIIVGEKWLWNGVDDSLIGMKINQEKIIRLHSENAYAENGVYYFDDSSKLYIVEKNEDLFLNVRIISIE